VSYGRLYVLPLIERFHRRYPEITLDLSFDDAYVEPESVTSSWRIAQPFVSTEIFSQLIVFPDTTRLRKKFP
jgi:hypothetical protein